MTDPEVKRIDIALQGGGAHGAFTWGVLDRLLEDERIEIGSISGTSARAMNAVAPPRGWQAAGAKPHGNRFPVSGKRSARPLG